jgi:predicted N-acetyltransferase YhbS
MIKRKYKNMNIVLRKEEKSDYFEVEELIKLAFRNMKISDHKEHLLVHNLRNSNSFNPELSIVAEYENRIVGHILLSEIVIEDNGKESIALSLAPVSVLPEFQNKGIGSKLIQYTHELASKIGYKIVVVLGHKNYYPRFGYVEAKKYGIKPTFMVKSSNFMVKELKKHTLQNIKGVVKYPKEFGI